MEVVDTSLFSVAATLVIGAVGGAWTLYVAQRSWKKEAEKEAHTRRIESQKPFLEIQLKTYVETSAIIGKLVSLPMTPAWREVEARFWALYWSELAMVEDDSVEQEMVKFGRILKSYSAKGGPPELKGPLEEQSLQVARTIRTAIERSWGAVRINVPAVNVRVGANALTTNPESP